MINILVLLAAQVAFAGGYKGNGGDVVICPNARPVLLDFFESDQPATKLKSATDSKVYIENFLSQLRPYAPLLAAEMKSQIANFFERVKPIRGIELGDVPDEDLLKPIDPDCVRKQVANRNPLLVPPGKDFVIQQDLFEQMDAENQVGLITHELFYQNSTAQSSREVRALNRALHNGTVTSTEFLLLLAQKAQIARIDYRGMMLDLSKEAAFYRSGRLKSVLSLEDEYQIRGSSTQLVSHQHNFYENGQVSELWFKSELSLPLKTGQWATFQNYGQDPLTFREDGSIKSGRLSTQDIATKYIRIHWYSSVFDKDENLAQGTFANGEVYEKGRANNTGISIYPRSTVEFRDQQRIICFQTYEGNQLQIQNRNYTFAKQSPQCFHQDGFWWEVILAEKAALYDENNLFVEIPANTPIRLTSEKKVIRTNAKK
jgi:hypothetical protein